VIASPCPCLELLLLVPCDGVQREGSESLAFCCSCRQQRPASGSPAPSTTRGSQRRPPCHRRRDLSAPGQGCCWLRPALAARSDECRPAAANVRRAASGLRRAPCPPFSPPDPSTSRHQLPRPAVANLSRCGRATPAPCGLNAVQPVKQHIRPRHTGQQQHLHRQVLLQSRIGQLLMPCNT